MIDKYFAEIEKFKGLNKKQEETASTEKMVLNNLRLVVKIAHEYKGMGVSLEDLIQEGNLGLMQASETFDKKRGNKFSTYAVHYIRMRMRNLLNDHRYVIKQSAAQLNTLNKINDFIAQYHAKHHEDPTISQIVRYTKLSNVVVKNALMHKISGIVSIDKPVSEDGTETLAGLAELSHDESTNPEHQLHQATMNEQLKKNIHRLSKKEQIVIIGRFFEDKTLQNLGDQLKMSAAGVKAVQDRALKKLRQMLLI